MERRGREDQPGYHRLTQEQEQVKAQSREDGERYHLMDVNGDEIEIVIAVENC